MDRRENSVDEKQIKISLPVTLAFAVGLAGMIGAGMASYYGGRLAVEKNFSTITERVVKIEAVVADVKDLKERVTDQERYAASIYQGVWILLNDRGYDADKILSKNND